MTGPLFSRKAAGFLIAGAGVSLLCWLFLIVFGDEISRPASFASDSYSVSALGHHAFVEMLRRTGVPVSVSRYHSALRAGDESLLVVIEPDLAETGRLKQMLDHVSRALVVLPKWICSRDFDHPAWAAGATLLPLPGIVRLLDDLGIPGEVIRDASGDWAVGRFGIAPTLATAQLTNCPELHPLLSCGGATLLGRVRRGRTDLYVLTDPDLISTHGLGRGENARLSAALIDAARGGGAVVVDETSHGHETRPSLWRELLSMPLLLAMIQALLALAAMLWAGMGRFGAPLPPPAGIRPGKGFLIENTAELLRFSGATLHPLERYQAAAVHEVARALRAPEHLSPSELRVWLAAIAEGRGLGPLARESVDMLAELRRQRRAPGHRVLAAARRMYRWKEEMIHGSSGNPGRRR